MTTTRGLRLALAIGVLSVSTISSASATPVVDQDLGGVIHLVVDSDWSIVVTAGSSPGYITVSGSALEETAEVCMALQGQAEGCVRDYIYVPGLPKVKNLPDVPDIPDLPNLPGLA